MQEWAGRRLRAISEHECFNSYVTTTSILLSLLASITIGPKPKDEANNVQLVIHTKTEDAPGRGYIATV